MQQILQKAHLNPYLHETELKGKGKWFRLYLGGYTTRPAAQHAGEQYRSHHLIPSFIVTKEFH